MQQYPHLFTPITLRGKKLRNRILTCPIGTSFFGPTSHMTDYTLEFFEEKARAGAAELLGRLPDLKGHARNGEVSEPGEQGIFGALDA